MNQGKWIMDSNPKIFLICRFHKGRKELLKRALISLNEQTYNNWEIIFSHETEEDREELDELLDLIPHWYAMVGVTPDLSDGECYFNKYLNTLKEHVPDAWTLIYDSDNFFYSKDSLKNLAEVLTDENFIYICQFVRNRAKPSDRQIENKIIKSGSIDSASIVFHSKYKDVAMFSGDDNADYQFCKEMTEKLPTQWHKIKVVCSDRRSRGLN